MNKQLLAKTLTHLERLVSFDTSNPPRNYLQSGIVEYLTSTLKNISTDIAIKVEDHGNNSINLFASKGKPKYLFNFHLDTVPVTKGWSSDPFKLSIKQGKAFALGACDIKGAAAAMLACIEQGLDNFAVLFSSDEEHGNSDCIKNFLLTKHDYQGVIVAEPTNAKAVLAHRGIHTAKIEFSADPGHSSEFRALSDNSIHQFTEWAQFAIGFAQKKQQQTYQNLSGICFNIGKVNAGLKANIICPILTAEFGLRPLPGQCSKELIEQLQSFTSKKNKAKVTTKFTAPSLPGKADYHNNFDLAESLHLPIGEAVSFWTEAALFSAAGYPAVVYGPGNIAQAHSANEWVSLQQLDKVAHHYMRIHSNE